MAPRWSSMRRPSAARPCDASPRSWRPRKQQQEIHPSAKSPRLTILTQPRDPPLFAPRRQHTRASFDSQNEPSKQGENDPARHTRSLTGPHRQPRYTPSRCCGARSRPLIRPARHTQRVARPRPIHPVRPAPENGLTPHSPPPGGPKMRRGIAHPSLFCATTSPHPSRHAQKLPRAR